MEFVNAINIEDEQCDSFSDSSIVNLSKDGVSKEGSVDQDSLVTEEPSLKGFLGKGKSRVVFNLRLNMERAQIVLMNENETQLATLSQDNLLTDIKVHLSSSVFYKMHEIISLLFVTFSFQLGLSIIF